MNGYLFTAGLTQTQIRPTLGRGGQMVDSISTLDSSMRAIVYGGDPEHAQRSFEAWCCQTPEGEKPIHTKIKKIVAAQFVDELLTEMGGKPLDWPKISQQINDILQATLVDDFEQGYWVDINQAVPPEKISFNVESLQRDLPEDIRSGLNWSPDKKFFFLISVFSPRQLPVVQPEALEPDEHFPDEASEGDSDDDRQDLDGFVAALPEMRDKETVALLEARNSVIAAWLWRKFAANTRLAANEIQIDPCCTLFPVQ